MSSFSKQMQKVQGLKVTSYLYIAMFLCNRYHWTSNVYYLSSKLYHQYLVLLFTRNKRNICFLFGYNRFYFIL